MKFYNLGHKTFETDFNWVKSHKLSHNIVNFPGNSMNFQTIP